MEDVSHGMLGFVVPGPLKSSLNLLKFKKKLQTETIKLRYYFQIDFSLNFIVLGLHLGLRFSSQIAPKRGSEPKGNTFSMMPCFFATQGVPQGKIFLDSGIDFQSFSVPKDSMAELLSIPM